MIPEKKGLFITFEGGEGAGKTTQIRMLAAFLADQGHDVVLTREPGGTPEAEKIRNLLVDRCGGDWSPVAECLLLFAARTMHVRDLIAPALDSGKIVLCDRFTDSTRAYQSFGHGVPLEQVESLAKLSQEGCEPDITILLDIDPQTGLGRSERRLAQSGSREDRFERLEFSFHRKLRNGYLWIARRDSGRCHVIDAAQSPEDIAQKIQFLVTERLSGDRVHP